MLLTGVLIGTGFDSFIPSHGMIHETRDKHRAVVIIFVIDRNTGGKLIGAYHLVREVLVKVDIKMHEQSTFSCDCLLCDVGI